MDSADLALSMIRHEGEDPVARKARVQAMQAVRRERCIRKPRGSQKKANRFKRKDVKLLIQGLFASRSKWAIAAAHCFVATVHTGVRPNEWANAVLIVQDGKPALRVINAKHTNGRTHGVSRTLHLGELSDAELAIIKRHLAILRPFAEQGRWEHYYEGCRQIIHDVAKQVYSRKRRLPSLYTARHMFAALSKKSFDRIEVAAMMGHDSVDTAGEHYAPAWSATGISKVRPTFDCAIMGTKANSAWSQRRKTMLLRWSKCSVE